MILWPIVANGMCILDIDIVKKLDTHFAKVEALRPEDKVVYLQKVYLFKLDLLYYTLAFNRSLSLIRSAPQTSRGTRRTRLLVKRRS